MYLALEKVVKFLRFWSVLRVSRISKLESMFQHHTYVNQVISLADLHRYMANFVCDQALDALCGAAQYKGVAKVS
jgi:hypothetical protein